MGIDGGMDAPQPVTVDSVVNQERSLGTGLDQVREFLTTLPSRGISIHGTLLSRAELIAQKGFLPDEEKKSQRTEEVEPTKEHLYII